MTHGAWKGPSNTANTQVSLVTTEGDSESVVKLPPVMAGMDRAEALAFVSRLYDSAQAGAHIWGDALLVKRFLTQCSRTGSQETRDGYRREVRRFMRWRDRNHLDLHLREIDPSLAQDWVDELRREVEAERMKPRPSTAGWRPSALCTDGRLTHHGRQCLGCRVIRSLAGLNSTPRSRPVACPMNRWGC